MNEGLEIFIIIISFLTILIPTGIIILYRANRSNRISPGNRTATFIGNWSPPRQTTSRQQVFQTTWV